MAVTLGSTGITFPDATTQTTAATSSTPPLTTNVRQAVTSSATTAINFSSGNTVDLTMAANITTMTFSGVAASGTAMLVQIVVRNASSGTAYTIVWPTSVYWNSSTAVTNQTAPTLASGANGVTVIALLTTDGGTKWRGWVESSIPGGGSSALWVWGQNGSGNLGLGNVSSYSSPKQVGALTNWAFVTRTSSNQAAAIKTDGTLWTWGYNGFGALGLGNATSYSSPKQVGALTTWSTMACSYTQAMCAIKTDGTMWSWGRAQFGVLGLGNGVTYSSPKQIGALTNWSKVGGGYGAFFAIKTDGTLWSWGNSNYGMGGRGSTLTTSSPQQIGASTDWASISSAGFRTIAAIKTTGTLWTWGYGNQGALGQGTTTSISNPAQVGALTNWSRVLMNSNSGVAIKTDGTLWVWGSGAYGQLGLGVTTNYSSPKQVGAATDWTSIGQSFCANSGTRGSNGVGALWVWGRNNGGQLGLGNVTNYSSPKQIGSFTDWKLTGGGVTEQMMALRYTAINPA